MAIELAFRNAFSPRPEEPTLFPRFAIVLILLIAFVFRVAGIDYAIPYTFGNVDEYVPVANAVSFLQSKSLQPVHFNYPALYFLILAVSYAIWFASGLVLGAFHSPGDFVLLFLTQGGLFHFVGRIVSVFLGTGTVWIVYRIAKRIAGHDSAVLASLLFACSTLHVELSHWALPDVPMTFFSSLAVLWMLSVYDRGLLKDYLIAAFFCGAALATKYNGFLIVLSFLVAHAQRVAHRAERPLSIKLLLAGCFVVVTFLLFNPYWIIQFGRAWSTFRFESTHMALGHPGQEGVRFLWPFLQLIERERVVGLICLIGMLGAFAWTDRWLAAFVLLPVTLTLVYVGSWSKASLHYAVFIFPLLAVLGGVTLDNALRWMRRQRWGIFFMIVSTSLVVLPSVVEIIVEDRSMMVVDTREEALRWIESNIPRGTSIAFATRENIPPLLDSAGLYFDGTRKAKLLALLEVAPAELQNRVHRFRDQAVAYNMIEAKRILQQPSFPEHWRTRVDTTNPYVRALFSIQWASLDELSRSKVSLVLLSSYDMESMEKSNLTTADNPWAYPIQEAQCFFTEVKDSSKSILLQSWNPSGPQRGPRLFLYRLGGAAQR